MADSSTAGRSREGQGGDSDGTAFPKSVWCTGFRPFPAPSSNLPPNGTPLIAHPNTALASELLSARGKPQFEKPIDAVLHIAPAPRRGCKKRVKLKTPKRHADLSYRWILDTADLGGEG